MCMRQWIWIRYAESLNHTPTGITIQCSQCLSFRIVIAVISSWKDLYEAVISESLYQTSACLSIQCSHCLCFGFRKTDDHLIIETYGKFHGKQNRKHHLEDCSNSQRQVVLIDEIEGKPRQKRIQRIAVMALTTISVQFHSSRWPRPFSSSGDPCIHPNCVGDVTVGSMLINPDPFLLLVPFDASFTLWCSFSKCATNSLFALISRICIFLLLVSILISFKFEPHSLFLIFLSQVAAVRYFLFVHVHTEASLCSSSRRKQLLPPPPPQL